MKDDAQAALLRRNLDEVLKKARHVPVVAPRRGWIYDIREALGMTGGDLSRRLGISQSALTKLEQSEAKGTIQLSSLRRIARVFDCTLVYALVPRKSLENTVTRRKRRVTLDDLGPYLFSKSANEYRELVDNYAKTIKLNRLWKERPGTKSASVQQPIKPEQG